MKHFFSIITFLIISVTYTYGQNINYYGNITDLDSDKYIANLTVAVYANGSLVTNDKTGANGSYSVSFPTGQEYTVKYTKAGYVTKIVILDVIDVVGEDMPAGGKIFPPINIDMFTERDGADFSFLETQPVVKWILDEGRMNFNRGQMQQIKDKIDTKLQDAEDNEKKIAAEYDNLIKEADAFYASKKYKEALNKYIAALQVDGKQTEAHPNSQLLKIEELLQKKEEEELAFQQENQAYLNLITAADNFASAKDYIKAVAKFNEAITMKSDEQYPKDRINELQEKIANAAKKEEFDKVVKRADGFFKQNSLQAARDFYKQAQKLLPKEEYPTKQLELISGKLNAQSAVKEQKDNYDKAVAEADALYNAESYAEAILKYKEAMTFESAATYPPGRIKMAKDLINAKAAEADKLTSFTKLVAEGDTKVTSKNYEIAVSKYTEAIALIKDPAAQTKLDNANQLLVDQKNKEQQKEQIATLMESALEKMGAEDYQNAIGDYSSILALVSTNPEALVGKIKAEDLLAAKQSKEAKENQFNELVSLADKAFDAKKWQEAKTKYLAAKVIYDDRDHVTKRIAEVETKIEQVLLDAQISALMTSANEKVTGENYLGAIADFEAALVLKADHVEATSGKKNAEELLAKRASQEEQKNTFDEFVAQADAAFGRGNWEEAKTKYTEAKAIFEDREYVNTQLTLVDEAIKNAAAKQNNLAKIQTLITEASTLKSENKWEEVIAKYDEILVIQQDRNDVIELLAAAKISKQEFEVAQSKQATLAQIQVLLDEATLLKPNNKWTEVIQKYDQALLLDAERNDISELLAAAKLSKQELEAAQSKAAIEAQIQILLDEASALKPDNKWTEVIQKYDDALVLDAKRNDISELLAAAKLSKQELEAAQSKAATEAQIQIILDEASALKPDNKWTEVILKYNEALELDSERTDVSELITTAKSSKLEWEAAQSKEETLAEIQSLLDEANSLKSDNKWTEAIQKYDQALALANGREDISQLLDAAKVSKQEWEVAQTQEKLELEFNAIVTDADNAFDQGEWLNAKGKYLSAKAIFDDREHVNTRISDANAALASFEATKEIAAQIETLLDEASALKPDNKWNEVIQKYEEALSIDDTRSDISQILAAAKVSKTEWEAAQFKKEQFAQLKQAGNDLLSEEKWNDAKVKYDEALVLNSDGEIEASLKIIEIKLAQEIASQNKEEEYANKMSAAEDFATNDKYKEALSKFNEALLVKQGDAAATNRIDDMQQRLDALAQAKNKDANYNEAMRIGNLAIESKDYSSAIKAFDDALIVIPEDAQAIQLKEEAETKIAELALKEQEYLALVNTALAKYDDAIVNDNNIPKLKEAKTIFTSAQVLRPEVSLPQEKIIEINNLLQKIEEDANASDQAANIEKLYQEQLQLANVAGLDKKLKNAINYLKEAQKIKPEQDFPTKEILRLQNILDSALAEKEMEVNYTSLLSKADLAFTNEEYENSIQLYNEALSIKKTEGYPKSQIALAQEEITKNTDDIVEEEYLRFMDKANTQSLNKEFDKALANYKSALGVKKNDTEAKDKIDEIEQILDNLLNAKRANESKQQQFDQFIADGDELFKSKKFIEASLSYRKATDIDVNDAYANNQLQSSIKEAKAKAAKNKELRYDKSISSGDALFNNEEYDRAIVAYKRALSIRNYEQYPQTQLAKIEATKNASVKVQGNVAYLGQQSNISIMEGAALLEKGEIQRERLNQDAVAAQLNKSVFRDDERSLSDFEERLAYENEVTSIKDIRDDSYFTDEVTKREIADGIDNRLYELEQDAAQFIKYKNGDLSRAGQQLTFVKDEFDQEKADYGAMHKEAIELIKSIENNRDNKDAIEMTHHDVKVTATSDELIEMNMAYDEYLVLNKEFQEQTQRQVNITTFDIDDKRATENNVEYESVIALQDAAILAEIRVTESTQEKDIIEKQLKEDIKMYEAQLDRRLAEETNQVREEQLKMDDQLTASGNKFEETQVGMDDSRLLAVEKLKDIDQEKIKQDNMRSQDKSMRTGQIYSEVEGIKTQQTEKALQNIKDLTLVEEDVTNRMSAFERERQQQENEEARENRITQDKLLIIDKSEELLNQENIENVNDNYEKLKGQVISIENKKQNSGNDSSKEQQEMQKFVDGIENNDVKYSETIANTIGDDYPEGVTQENYVRDDSKGIPIKIVTRRIVVTDGRGEVFIRIQTRNGLTYSKNGSAISEQTWIYGTESAKLEKHY